MQNKQEIIEKYGFGVCDAFGSEHCVGRCQDTRDCGAIPIPKLTETELDNLQWAKDFLNNYERKHPWLKK